MLESMTVKQYREWLAFFKIRQENETRALQGAPQERYGENPEDQLRMSNDILRTMSGYQNRRDKRKA